MSTVYQYIVYKTLLHSSSNDTVERDKRTEKVSPLQSTISETVILQLAPVVQEVNNAIQQEHSSKPLKHSIVKRSLVFKREIGISLSPKNFSSVWISWLKV